jgi:23S rRNA pseudouridine2605 synthase
VSQRGRRRGRRGHGHSGEGEQQKQQPQNGGESAGEPSGPASEGGDQPAAEQSQSRPGEAPEQREPGSGQQRRRGRRPRRRGGERREEGTAPADRRQDNRSPARGAGRPEQVERPDAPTPEPEDDDGEEYVPREPTPPPEMPLVTYLARAGLGSRRYCDEIIGSGRVTVDGEVVTFPRESVPSGAEVSVDGEKLRPRELRYVLVNKPRGVASTRSDPHASSVVVDMVGGGRTLFPVGRLDVETTGLLVLTNDGPLAHRLMHPSYGVPKTYVVRVRGRVGKRALGALRDGVELEDGMTSPAQARVLKQTAKTAVVELTIHQGRKRQVRRMFAALGLPVDELHRRRYGPLQDKGLAVGETRELSAEEVDALQRAAEQVDSRVLDEPVEHPVLLAAEQDQTAGTPAAATQLVEHGYESTHFGPPGIEGGGAQDEREFAVQDEATEDQADVLSGDTGGVAAADVDAHSDQAVTDADVHGDEVAADEADREEHADEAGAVEETPPDEGQSRLDERPDDGPSLRDEPDADETAQSTSD